MKTTIKRTETRMVHIPADLAESLGIPDSPLELHQMAAGPLLMKGEMTAAQVLAMLDDLHALTDHLLECLQDACGPCDDFCDENCPFCSKELFRLPNSLLVQAGIPENAKLRAIPDPENQCVYVEEAAPCSSISLQGSRGEEIVLEAGLCLRELNRHLRKDDVVYGGN